MIVDKYLFVQWVAVYKIALIKLWIDLRLKTLLLQYLCIYQNSLMLFKIFQKLVFMTLKSQWQMEYILQGVSFGKV